MIKRYITILLSFLCGISLLSQSNNTFSSNFKVEYFTIEEGLSNNKVNAICKDKFGFMWFGTNEGLNKYDGNNTIIYKNDKSDTTSISNNLIRDIINDSDGRLWIGTDDGLNYYNPDIDGFVRVSISKEQQDLNFVWDLYEDKNGVLWIATHHGLYYKEKKSNEVIAFKIINSQVDNPHTISVCLDSRNILWVGTRKHGLLTYNFNSGESKQFNQLSNDDSSISGDRIEAIYEDKKGNLWFGTSDKGLNRFNRETSSFSRISLEDNLAKPLGIRKIVEDKYGKLWLGTGGGVYLKDPNNLTFRRFADKNHVFTTLNHNSIYDIYIDDIDIIWLGTYAGGVNYIDLNQKKFNHFYFKENNNNLLNSSTVYTIFEDSEENLWVGTVNGGVNYYDRETKTFEYILNDPKNANSLSGNNIKAIIEDKLGNIWIGTYRNGLNYYNRQTKTFKHYQANAQSKLGLTNDNIYDLLLDSEDNLWIATEQGLDLWPKGSNEIIHLGSKGREKSIFEGDRTSMVFEDSRKNIWVGTYNHGLLLFNKSDSSFTEFKADVIHGNVYSISEDTKNQLWIGGPEGLFYLNLQNDSIINYTEKDGLPVNRVFKAFDDKAGNLWISTAAGLSKFINAVNTPHIPNFRNYDTDDGLQSNQFVYNSNDKSRSGEMYFGGINGFTAFNPEEIADNPYKAVVVINGLKIFNDEVEIGEDIEGRVVLEKPIIKTEELVLSYKHYVFTLQFSALHFARPNKNKYAYRLEGFDPKDSPWNYTDADNRNATYTNLSGGEYIFKVKASNNDGVWSEHPTILKIKILPPFWKTWWFISLVIFTFLLSIASIFLIRVNTLKKQKQVLEVTVSERTVDLKNANADLQRQKETISTLSEFGQKLTATMNLYSINNKIFDYVSSLMDTTSFGISVYQHDTKDLVYPAMIENRITLPKFSRKLSEKSSCAVWCYLNQEVIFSNNFPMEYTKYIEDLNLRTRIIPESIIYIPLTVEKKKIGVLTVQSNRKNAYTQYDYTILQTLASYIAIALDNANVYSLIKEKNSQLEQQALFLNETNTLLEERQQTIEEQSEELMTQKEELVKANSNLRELNSTKDKFFSIIAHDIKNPFQSVLGFSELLVNRFNSIDDAKRKRFAQAIFESSSSIYKLLENLLQWSRAQTNTIKFAPENLYLYDRINENITLLLENINNKEIEISIDNPENIEVYADKDMLNTIIRNILSNAIKFTGIGGKILISCSKKDNDVVLSIKDTGLGMDEEDITNLFEIDKSFTREGTSGERGTGLGLLICKEFVENHSGKIWVESELGKGSTFYFSIPKPED